MGFKFILAVAFLLPTAALAQKVGLQVDGVNANENTTITFSTDALVEGKSLKAGKYGFFVANSIDIGSYKKGYNGNTQVFERFQNTG